MPCGGIYPISDANPDWWCFYCGKTGCDHFCEEWDCGLHEACVIPFLHTDEGEVVLDHKHHIQIGMFVLQEEDGDLMDPTQVLADIRKLIVGLQPLREETNTLDAGDIGDDVVELMDKFENLDDWLKLGGYIPKDWKTDG